MTLKYYVTILQILKIQIQTISTIYYSHIAQT